MKKILYIIKSLGRGGAETLLLETVKYHDHSKYEFHCIYFLPWKNQLVEDLEANGVKVINIPAHNNLDILRSTGKVRDYINENGIDLIHCHLPWAGFLGRILYLTAKLPVVYTEHNVQERYHWLTRFINRMTFRMQSHVIAVSEDVRNSITKRIGSKPWIQTLINGIDSDRFVRDVEAGFALKKSLGIPQEAIVMGSIGVFRTQKCLDKWLMLFAEWKKVHKTGYGLLIGDGPLMEMLKDKRRELNLEESVIMPGIQKNVVEWYSAIDLFVMTSAFEGMPLALLEAMSCGCVPITTDAGGIKEIVRQGIDGAICPVDEWETLSTPIQILSQDHHKRKNFSLAARARIVHSFDIRRLVVGLEKSYDALLATSR